MRCLGVPNTAHFANVTLIEDAIARPYYVFIYVVKVLLISLAKCISSRLYVCFACVLVNFCHCSYFSRHIIKFW